MNLSEHFTFEELTDSNGHPDLVPQNRVEAQGFIRQLTLTAQALEETRAILGGYPMNINSGFRGPSLNRAVGGSATGAHPKGLAADTTPSNMSIDDAFDTLMQNIDQCPTIRKVIKEQVGKSVWLHIEARISNDQPQQFYTTTDGRTYTEVYA